MKTKNSQITQSQLRDILCLEEEVKMIRERIRNRRTQVAAALAAGAEIEYGPHTAVLGAAGQAQVYPWRGAILRHDAEDVKHIAASRPEARPSAGPLLIPVYPTTPVA